ncbi:MAG: hypothetical protein KI791_10325 [Cyclobacteriaceae bacterium]|nr:hypothetical protein [Cyclobacteriaceae bacterium SS2]
MRISLQAIVLFSFLISTELNAQNNASSFLIGIIESFNQQFDDLDDFISPDAIGIVDGIRADSSALIVLRNNYRFLQAVYNHPKITIQELVADKSMAMAEWAFTDSIGLVATGMISIHLRERRIQQIKIFNGSMGERTGTDESSKRVSPRRTGGRQQRPSEAEPAWWYFLRHSQGGFADRAGLYVSQAFPCESPEKVTGDFEILNLKGPYNNRQNAGQDRQINLNSAKNPGMTIFNRDANCDN